LMILNVAIMNIVMMVNVNKPKGGDYQRINDDHNCFDVSHFADSGCYA